MDPLSERLAKLSPEKLAALMERLNQKDGGRAPSTSIPRRTGTGPSPTSFSQQRLWFIDRLEQGTIAYNVLSVTRFDGALDVGAMQRALDTVLRRHEALRTVFGVQDDAPVQVVLPEVGVPLELEDLSGLPEAEREEAVAARVNAAPKVPLDLAQGPLLRASLLRLAPERHILLLVMHHIVSDGWSRGVMLREISTAYAAYVRGEDPQLPELPIQFPDYAVWQRGHLTGATLEKQLGYWTERLRGAPPALELPADRPRPALQSFEGRVHRFRVPGPLSDALRRLAREEEATLFMVLLAAFKLLLARYSGETDVVVGSPVANRGRPETQGLIGFFANTLALRTDLGGDPTFRAALRRVRDAALGAYAHEELPFERVVEALHPERDLSRTPVFQTMFLLDNTPVKSLRLPNLELVPVRVDSGSSSFDLTLMVEEKEDGLAGGFEYATALFDEAAVERMAGSYLRLLEGIAADPGRRISRLAVMTEAERARVTGDFAATAPAPAADVPVHRLFEARAAATPDAPALVHAGGTLTYAELDRRARGLAARLRREGAGPEGRVGVLLERSPEAVVAMLAALMAGAAYVPLDPAYPRERLRFMAEDAGLALLVARAGTADALGLAIPATDPDAEDDETGGGLPEVDGACAAYVIYTSGSTGRPKGVVVEHRQLAAYVAAATEAYGIVAADRVLQFASPSFDISVEEIFPTLASGAALVLRGPGELGSVDAFLEETAARGVTVMSLPTAFWHEVTARLEGGGPALPPSLRLTVLGGERAQEDRLAAWRERAEGRRLLNTYGPTETTVVATLFDLSGDAPVERIPIGRPIAGARAYVLDAALEPVPAGVPGELFVGGAGVARGYLDRPELTAERFLPDAFGGEPGARMYRTGDRVRWLEDGALDFLGRADQQAKVRGFRVEPGEVESVLRAHPAVAQAAAAVRGPGDAARLVGWFQPGADAPAEDGALAGELRDWLEERLPAYLVPSALVEVASWPLTPVGKTDLRALPDPAEAGGADAPDQQPASALEEVLAGIWAEALGVERLGVRENLFQAGAHSLLVTRVLSQTAGLFGVDVPVRALFVRPTVADMAEALLAAAADPAAAERVAELVLDVSTLSDDQVHGMLGAEPVLSE